MLNIIAGPAKSGKTTLIYNEIEKLISAGTDGVFLIIPEQFSFSAERELIKRLGVAAANRVNICSFTKLCEEIGRCVGGMAGRVVTDPMRLVIMKRALSSVRDHLSIYKNYWNSADFAENVTKIVTELKQYDIAPDALSDLKMGNDALCRKMQDISLIAGAYNTLLGRAFIDPLDMESYMCERAAGRGVFHGKTVFFDSFKGFTAPQLKLIEIILEEAENVTLSAPCVSLDDDGDTDLFAGVRRTVRAVVALAKKHGIPVKEPLILRDTHFASDGMKRLEAFLSSRGAVEGDCAGEVKVVSAPSVHDEINFVFSEIRRLIRTRGFRYRDFAIVARDIRSCDTVVDMISRRYGVPCFFDRRMPVSELPLFRLVFAALRAAESFDTDDILSLIKSPIFGCKTEDGNAVERYVYMWGIEGRGWLSEWDLSPGGLDRAAEDDAEVLKQINSVRRRIVGSLSRLSALLGSAEEIAGALYAFLQKNQVPENLSAYAVELEASGFSDEAEYQRGSWDILMSSLDEIARSSADDELDSENFIELLRLFSVQKSVGSIPQGLDEVIFGSADRIRTVDTKAAFIVGAFAGNFPKSPVSDGLLSAQERQALINNGIPIKDKLMEEMVDEQLCFYSSLCLASQLVYISYSTADFEGNAKEAADAVRRIAKSLCGETIISAAKDGFRAKDQEWPSAAFENLSAAWNENTADCASAKQYFSQCEEFSARCAAIDLAGDGVVGKLSPKTAVDIFGKNLSGSASRIELFYKCPFSYFCRYGLKAAPLKKADLNALTRGTLIHYFLEKMIAQHKNNVGQFTREELRDSLKKLAAQYFENAGVKIPEYDKRFIYSLDTLIDQAAELLIRIGAELAQSDFQPVAFELGIGKNGEIPPLKVGLESGSMTLSGSIDRMDASVIDNTTYLRVIDYKTGKKEFALSEVLYGLNMQMLIYLYAVLKSEKYKNSRPAGVLYLPSGRQIQDKNDDRNVIKMNGILNDDKRVLAAMDKNLNGDFVPAKLKKDGGFNKQSSSVIPEDEFSNVFAAIERLIKQMGDALHSGDIAVRPLKKGGDTISCKYCDYREICRRDSERGSREIKSYTIEEALERMKVDECE